MGSALRLVFEFSQAILLRSFMKIVKNKIPYSIDFVLSTFFTHFSNPKSANSFGWMPKPIEFTHSNSTRNVLNNRSIGFRVGDGWVFVLSFALCKVNC